MNYRLVRIVRETKTLDDKWTVPVELYKFCISLQTQMTGGMTSFIGGEIGEMSNNAQEIIMNLNMGILITQVMIIMIGYCVIKVFLQT